MTGRRDVVRPVRGFAGLIVAPAGQGPAGPASSDHGYVSYGEAASATTIMLMPGDRQQLVFPATTSNGLLAASPFAGHVFWDGSAVRPRKAGDTMILRLDLTSSAFVANGDIEIQLDIGGSFGVIQTVPRALKKPAGVLEKISESFPVFVGATFVANGGALYLTTSVPTTISMVALLVFPLTAAP